MLWLVGRVLWDVVVGKEGSVGCYCFFRKGSIGVFLLVGRIV